MLTFRDLISGLQALALNGKPLIVHASVRSFGEIRGGAETLLGALLQLHPRLMAPAHTYTTMIIPESGPDHNGMIYGSGADLNRMAQMYRHDMPCDRMMGALPETLRRHPMARRSAHPTLSFTGIGVEDELRLQNLDDPLAPIAALLEQDGWVLLLGVDHTVNTSIHLAEKLAGRRQFTRWALTGKGVVGCKGFPGCSLGFEQIAPQVESDTRTALVGEAHAQALPLRALVDAAVEMIDEDADALLCDDPACERCAAVREG